MANNGTLSVQSVEGDRGEEANRGGVVNKRKEAEEGEEEEEEEEEWMESAIVSASSISSYINVSCTISLITVSPPHWLYPLVQGEGHHSLSSRFIVFLPARSLNRFTLSPLSSSSLRCVSFPPLSLPLPVLSPSPHSLHPHRRRCHRRIPHPSLLSLCLSWRCVTSCPHETSQFSASSADE